MTTEVSKQRYVQFRTMLQFGLGSVNRVIGGFCVVRFFQSVARNCIDSCQLKCFGHGPHILHQRSLLAAAGRLSSQH